MNYRKLARMVHWANYVAWPVVSIVVPMLAVAVYRGARSPWFYVLCFAPVSSMFLGRLLCNGRCPLIVLERWLKRKAGECDL